ncbi:Vi polysaccharide ABC transporter protein VexA, partial [Salmonella enterica subsp. enterica]
IPRAVFKSSLINQDDPRYNLVEVTPTLKLSAPDTVPKTIVERCAAYHYFILGRGWIFIQ